MTEDARGERTCSFCSKPLGKDRRGFAGRRGAICFACAGEGANAVVANLSGAIENATAGEYRFPEQPVPCTCCEKAVSPTRSLTRNGASICGSCLVDCVSRLLAPSESSGEKPPSDSGTWRLIGSTSTSPASRASGS